MERKTAGKIVKEYRERKGFTQQALAEAIGIESRATICEIEKDRCGIPDGRFFDLCDALGVDYQRFLEELAEVSPKRYRRKLDLIRRFGQMRQYRPSPPSWSMETGDAGDIGLMNIARSEGHPRVDKISLIGHQRPWYILSDSVPKAVRWLVRMVSAWFRGPEFAVGT